MRVERVLGVLGTTALLAAVLVGCDPGPPALGPQTDGNFPQPRRFDVRGDAEVKAGSINLPGTFDMQYFLLPGDRVLITSIEGDLEDQIVRRERIFGPDISIPMHCNETSLDGEAEGAIAGTALSFAAGSIRVRGLTFDERGPGEVCHGQDGVLPLMAASRDVATGVHEPDVDHMELAAPITVQLAGSDRSGSLTLTGDFVNRPPHARIGSRAEGLYDFLASGGCPPVMGQSTEEGDEFSWPEPPEIEGNHPDGLEVVFRSLSSDPDAAGVPVFENEQPRVDIASEQWAHWRDDDYRVLGRGRELAPILFDRGPLHRVLLTITDRSGARSQAECRFIVADDG